MITGENLPRWQGLLPAEVVYQSRSQVQQFLLANLDSLLAW
ncbi:MAG: hypothetical protein QOD87_716 [Pseudonocardiales bacterium]|jgi:hypothetical protein|nr:hypothetical protein [Pseudonocardiales bacterium]